MRSKPRQPRGAGTPRATGAAAIAALWLVQSACVAAEALAAEWSAAAFLGGAASLRTTLRIEQSGERAIERSAKWSTRAFEPPLYYALRIARAGGDRTWALELVHHKLHLRDRPPEVQEFAVSHGYNLLTLGLGQNRRGVTVWARAGAVIAHPENTVRGRRLPQSRGALGSGYYLAGAAVGASVAKSLALGPDWFASLEGGFAGSMARVPIEGGHADVPNAALHLWAGFGRRW